MTRNGMIQWALIIGLAGFLVGCSGVQTATMTSPSAVLLAGGATSSQAVSSPSRNGSDDPPGVDDSGRGSSDSGHGSDDSGVRRDDSPNGFENAAGGGPTLRIRCELRSAPARARVSADGSNLPTGSYSARVLSGGVTVTTAARPTVRDEVEFDFDSNPNDIAAGATAISARFIQGGTVTGALANSAGVVVATATASCDVR